MDILAIVGECNTNWGQKVLVASKHILEGLEAYDNALVKGDPRGLFEDSVVDDYRSDIKALGDVYDEACEAYHKISSSLDEESLTQINGIMNKAILHSRLHTSEYVKTLREALQKAVEAYSNSNSDLPWDRMMKLLDMMAIALQAIKI